MKLFFLITSLQMFFTTLQAQTEKDSAYYSKISSPKTKMIPVYNGKYNVFTEKVGNGKIDLLVLHGGPGNSHEYFEIFPENLKRIGVTVYYYDQLGSYFSDNPADSSIWNISRFVEEVEEVRKGLQLNNFYLLGHSWGGMLAELYSAKYGHHLKGLILSNVPGFISKDATYLNSIIDSIDNVVRKQTALLPKFLDNKAQIDSIAKRLVLNDSIAFTKLSEQYNKVNDSIFLRTMYYNKTGRLPEPLRRSMRHVMNDGMDKFNFNPFAADYKNALKQIKVPTLLLGAKNDFVQPQLYYDLKKMMINAKVNVYICPNGAHFTMWDDTENYFRALGNFISEVESN